MTFVERRNRLIEALTDYLGRPVLLSDQVQPEEAPPYIIYSVTADYIPDGGLGDYSYQGTGNEEEIGLEEVRAEQPTASMSFTACSVNRWEDDEAGGQRYIFGEDEAQELAERAQGFFIHTGEEKITASGFTVVDVLNAASRSVMVIDEMARRYGFDVRLRYCRADSRSISTVEKVNPIGNTKKE